MALTLADFQTAIGTHGLGSRGDVTTAQQTAYLNMAQERLARVHDWRELRQTTDITLSASGTAEADKTVDLETELGATFRGIANIVIEDSAESSRLEMLPFDQFDSQIPLPEYYSRNRPRWGTLWTDTELILHPVPDAAYTARVRWLKWPTALASSGDTSDFKRKDDLLIHLTLSFVLSLARVEDSLKHFGIYQSLLREAIGQDRENPELVVIRPNFLLGSGAATGEYWRNPWYRG